MTSKANIFSVETLTGAWEEVLSNDAEDGILSRGVERFELDLEERIEELHAQLLADCYVPRDLTEVKIPKKDGERVLHVPAVRDRIVERCILEAVTPLVDPFLGSASYAYRPGLGVDDAVRALVELREEGLGWVLRTDVHDCFPTIPVPLAQRRLAAIVQNDQLMAVVEALLARLAVVHKRGRQPFDGLPQGAPLSPLLANLVLVDIDDSLQEAGFPVVRYADDLTVATSSEAEAWEAARVASRAAAEIGVSMGADKTAVMSFQEGFSFLGEDFGSRYPPALSEGGSPEPDRKVLYVARQGSRVAVRRGRVLVETKGTELLSVPTSQVGRLVCFGSVGVSAGVRTWALSNDVHIALASRRGSYLGAIVNDTWPARSARVRAQLGFEGTPEELVLARGIVDAKLDKQATVLRRFGRREHAETVRDAVSQIRGLRRMTPDATNRAELMGLEGAAAAVYWPCFGKLMPTGLQFTLRSRQPPQDVANSALSFLYTLLLGECVTAIHAAGLDPGIGVLHSTDDRKPSLALDLMEEFRPLLVDQTVLSAARRSTLTDQHGRTPAAKSGIWLTAAGREAVIGAYEMRLLQRTKGALVDFTGSWRRHLYRQAHRLRQTIMGGDGWTALSWR